VTPRVIDSFTGPYRFLSNFYLVEVKYRGLYYPSSEHAFQASKSLLVSERKMIRDLLTPGDAKRAGQRIHLRPDWEKIKVLVMEKIVRKKFGREDILLGLLLTNGALLIEGNNHGDRFWGQVKGVGENHLGIILMTIRDEKLS